MELTKTVGLYY